ncbi:DUF3027 domain-containing protein [Pseudarthrobacter albicanus]|uniref:DUF3027 domain-containing protein n=1 Tax=Pseudarthrobacter albicanus TaxID=2823873 RepID=UPI001BA4F7F0|nr:DUF3027 domain-containing protein [Pseudarthrobacter albicanus]
MTPEPEQNAPKASGPAGLNTAGKTAGTNAAGRKDVSKPRAGVPLWRTGKPDAVLAAAVDVARTAVEGIAPAWQIGKHLGARTEGDRLVTHLFESQVPGYQGWQWYAVLTRNSRSKIVTVDELGLLPSEDSILAPEWIPWAERVRPEDEQGDDAAGTEAVAAPVELAPGEPGAEDGYGADENDDDGDDVDADDDSEERDASAAEAD